MFRGRRLYTHWRLSRDALPWSMAILALASLLAGFLLTTAVADIVG